MLSDRNRRCALGLICLTTLFFFACSSKKTVVVLLPEQDNPQSAVAVGEGDQLTVIDRPLTVASVGSRGQVDQEEMTAADVEKTFSQALAAQPPAPISFTLYFREGSTTVLPQSRGTLNELFTEVARRQAVEVQVTGHTDTVGREKDNDTLSARRAEVIKKMLVNNGLQADFIRAVGRGERELLVPTADNVQEPKNRRVEVIVR
jgi:outer membrane protein OmpA-like peptidoglycan-associated protein